MNLIKWMFLLLLILGEFRLIGCKRGGGSRGGSRSRGGSSSIGTSQPRRNSYSKGTGVGSLVRSTKVKKGLRAAIAAYTTYKAGKIIIKDASRPMVYGGQSYYLNPNYYKPQPGYSMCKYHLVATDNILGRLSFQDNRRVRQLAFGCPSEEYCCGLECCIEDPNGGLDIGIGSLVRSTKVKKGLSAAIGAYITYKAGKMIIKDASRPMVYGEHSYYLNPTYYKPQPGYIMCKYDLVKIDDILGRLSFQDNRRVRQLVFGCPSEEYCCGLDCCIEDPNGGLDIKL